MNVLSLFDGISCGQVALERTGFKTERYYASEIEKNPIAITQKHYPNTVQLGDVQQVKGEKLGDVDLLMGGSPCQGFSLIGKQLNFDDPRSKLFFEYVRLLEETKPKYFLLENVPMKKESQDIITKYLGVEPTVINSALVSAQNRKRLYWTNITGVTQPEDKGILLESILESGNVNRDKSLCLTRRYAGFSGSQSYLRRRYFGKSIGQAVFENTTAEEQKQFWKQDPYGEFECDGYIRQLTPLECERLQTLPDGYTEGMPKNARYEAIGNGWTVDVIAHILSFIE